MSWEKVKLEDLCISITDGDHQSLPLAEDGIPFIVIADINSNNRIDFSNARYVPLDYYEKLDEKRKPQKGDVLLTVKGSFGIPVYVADDTPFVFQRDIAILKCNEKINPRFLYYYMKNREFYLYTDSIAIGAAQRAITLKALKNTIIRLPPLDTQAGIVNLLSAYDDLIENNQKQIKLLEEAAQRLYKEWFVDLRFPGHENTPIVDGVPEGWSSCKLSDVISFKPKVKLTKERMKQFVPMQALSTNSMVLDTSQFTATASNSGSKFQNGDTLLARITPCLENGKTAFVTGIESDEGAVGSTEFIVMRSKELNPYMVYLLARTDDFRQAAINSMTGSDGRQRAQVDKLEVLPYLKPTRNVIDSFAHIAEPMFKQIDVKRRQIQHLTEARDMLLPKLMNGEIEV